MSSVINVKYNILTVRTLFGPTSCKKCSLALSSRLRILRLAASSVPLAVVYFHSLHGLGRRLRYSSAHGHLGPGRALKGNQGRLHPPASHLLFRWEPPARVFEPLEVLKFDPDVLYVELEQVPESCQVLRGGLGVGRRVLGDTTRRVMVHISRHVLAAVVNRARQHTHHALLAEAEELLDFLRHEHLGAANCVTNQLKN